MLWVLGVGDQATRGGSRCRGLGCWEEIRSILVTWPPSAPPTISNRAFFPLSDPKRSIGGLVYSYESRHLPPACPPRPQISGAFVAFLRLFCFGGTARELICA